MKQKFRAWHKTWEEMGKVKRIRFDDEGNVTTVLFEGKILGVNTHADEIELMQSTGLKDKNGQEIFEGDVVSIDTDEFDLLFVKYEAGIYWLMDGEECVEHLSDYYKYVSIVGNIYENPELLEDSK